MSDPYPSGKPCLEGGQCGDCQPGNVQKKGYGRCGTRSRTCDANTGVWSDWGECEDEGGAADGIGGV